MEACTEEKLVELLHQGDQNALKEVIRRHGCMVARVVKGMLGDVPEAEDIGQETFIRFWSSLKTYRHEAKLSTFLVRIAMNLSLNEIKSRKKRIGFFAVWKSERTEEKEIKKSNFDEDFANNQLVEMILAKLDEAHRSVVILRLIEGFSTKETARLLNIPMGTVLSRLSRAQEKMREIIKAIE